MANKQFTEIKQNLAGKWVIRRTESKAAGYEFDSIRYLVWVSDDYHHATFAGDLKKARPFVTKDGAEHVAHKLWLSNYGEYKIVDKETR